MPQAAGRCRTGATIGRRILDREQHRTAPLAAQAQALTERHSASSKARDADLAYAGNIPMAKVDTPMVASAATSVVLRPIRSPK